MTRPHPLAGGIDRAIRLSTTSAVLAVAGIAAYVSYWRAYAVVRAYGETGITARLEPATIDGLIYASSIRRPAAAGRRPASAATRSVTAVPVSPVSWSRVTSPAIRRNASTSSRCGTGRIIPISSSGTRCADLASRPHRDGEGGSADWSTVAAGEDYRR
jgi:hypothetical protein